MKQKGISPLKAIAAGIVLASFGASAGHAEMSDDQAMLERIKIEDMLGRSGLAFDAKDVDGWLATFAPDGELVTQYQVCKGKPALRAYMTGGMSCVGTPGGSPVPGAPPRQTSVNASSPGAPAAGPMTVSHHVSQGVITFENDDTARYHANWATIASGSGGGRIVSAGFYDDTIVKVDGKWLIRVRQLLH